MQVRALIQPEAEVLTPYDSVAKAARLMRGRGVAVLAVVENRAQRKVLGAVADRQLLLECTAAGHDPRRCPIWNHLDKDVARVRPEQEVSPPAEQPGGPMLARQAVLVVDPDDRLLGVVEPPATAAAIAAQMGQQARS